MPPSACRLLSSVHDAFSRASLNLCAQEHAPPPNLAVYQEHTCLQCEW